MFGLLRGRFLFRGGWAGALFGHGLGTEIFRVNRRALCGEAPLRGTELAECERHIEVHLVEFVVAVRDGSSTANLDLIEVDDRHV